MLISLKTRSLKDYESLHLILTNYSLLPLSYDKKKQLDKWCKVNLLLISWKAQWADYAHFTPACYDLVSSLNNHSPPNIILLGKSGSGKGTIARDLERNLNYCTISIGDMHREENKRGSNLGIRIRSLLLNNRIDSKEMSKISHTMLRRKLKIIVPSERPVIFDHFPTFSSNIPYMEKLIKEFRLTNVVVIVPDISDSESLKRLHSRIVCSSYNCREIYNLLTKPPKNENICDTCGSPLVNRIDYTQVNFNKKISFYRNVTEKVMHLLGQQMTVYHIQNLHLLLQRYVF
ncbi:MAG: nucleoside monophosphate kinase [Candidatus Lokiarchaeota archaeon]|nr:nucleoside monophosphate kinase [Candidatus Lokiarchaeota archaeon]